MRLNVFRCPALLEPGGARAPERLEVHRGNRTVKLRWLDETIDMFLAGMSDADIGEALRDRLKDELSGRQHR